MPTFTYGGDSECLPLNGSVEPKQSNILSSGWGVTMQIAVAKQVHRCVHRF